MIFQFDLGNSAVKWRALETGKPVARGVFSHQETFPPYLAAKASADDEFQIASVANAWTTERLLTQLAQHGAKNITCAVSQCEQMGLVNVYSEPSAMGVDRWLAMLAAWHYCRQPFVVVDAGSAVTIDVVQADGQHQGGFILPGRHLMLDSLQRGTSRVIFELEEDPAHMLGTDTQSCVSRGVSWLSQALAKQIEATAAAYNISAIWVTGGDARHLLDAGLVAEYAPDMVMDGLSLYCGSSPEVDV